MKDSILFKVIMLIPSFPHMYFFHFNDTCYLDSNGATKFLESTVVFDSSLEGCSNIGSRMLYLNLLALQTSKCIDHGPKGPLMMFEPCLK